MLPDHLVEKALHGKRLESFDLDNGLHLKSNLLDEMSINTDFKQKLSLSFEMDC